MARSHLCGGSSTWRSRFSGLNRAAREHLEETERRHQEILEAIGQLKPPTTTYIEAERIR
jgi:hypothetical protein